MTAMHPNDEILENYAMGRLGENEAGGLEEHLIVCGGCRSRLEQTEEFIAAFRQAAPEPAAAAAKVLPFRMLRRTLWAPLAVAAALVLGIFTYFPLRDGGAAPAVLLLQPLRGPEAGAVAESGRRLVLVLDFPATSTAGYEAEIVDGDGGHVLRMEPELREGKLAIRVRGLRRGGYWVRLYERRPALEQIEEYRVQVR